MAKYIVRPGASFRMPDGSVKSGGDEVELDSDVASIHANSVDPLPETQSGQADSVAQ